MTQDEYRNAKFRYEGDHIWMGNIDIMSGVPRAVYESSVQAICDKVKPKRVLEIGYGLGIAADIFRKNHVTRHFIVEPNKELVANADTKGRVFLNDFIQNIKGIDEEFDLLYNDIFDLTGSSFSVDRFRYRWYAPLFLPGNQAYGNGFYFECQGERYFQRLEKNHIFAAFYGNT